MADHWKSLANQLGTPGIDEPETENTEDTAPEAQSSATEAPHADIESSQSMENPPSTPPQGSSATVPKPQEKPTKQKPPKRKSSWETLANLFNISVEREEPEPESEPEVADNLETQVTDHSEPQVETAAPKQQPPQSELAIFDEPKSEDNPALEAMFGDAPRARDDRGGWGKPKRVVNDLGWDDDDDAPVVEDDLPTAKSDDSEITDEAAPDPDAPRRGRRRRRRGRRGGRGSEDESVAKNTDDSNTDEANTDDSEDDSLASPTSWKADVVDVESADNWPEPDSFELEDASDTIPLKADRGPSNRTDNDDDSDDDGEAVRRSNRRRRGRGRGRGRTAEEGATSDARREGSREDSRGRVSARARDLDSDPNDRGADADDGPKAPDRKPEGRNPEGRNPEGSDSEGQRGSEESRGRRRRRPRPTSARRDAEAEAAPPGTDTDTDVDPENDSSDDLPEQQHRNIPTWNDSLESIIQANTENHKRNEGRGGPRGGSRGGKSRGRR